MTTDHMTAAELLTITEWLGLTQRDLARYLNVGERTVRRWIKGEFPIPEGVRLEVERLEADTDGVVDALIASLVASLHEAGEAEVFVYRTDADMLTARPELLPARWWRMVVARAACEVPSVVIKYAIIRKLRDTIQIVGGSNVIDGNIVHGGKVTDLTEKAMTD